MVSKIMYQCLIELFVLVSNSKLPSLFIFVWTRDQIPSEVEVVFYTKKGLISD